MRAVPLRIGHGGDFGGMAFRTYIVEGSHSIKILLTSRQILVNKRIGSDICYHDIGGYCIIVLGLSRDCIPKNCVAGSVGDSIPVEGDLLGTCFSAQP